MYHLNDEPLFAVQGMFMPLMLGGADADGYFNTGDVVRPTGAAASG